MNSSNKPLFGWINNYTLGVSYLFPSSIVDNLDSSKSNSKKLDFL